MTGKIWIAPPVSHAVVEAGSGFRVVDDVRAGMDLGSQSALDAWLKPDLAKEVACLSIPGVDDVVVRIAEAIRDEARILIFGDYDCDGVTSTSILVSALRAAHASPEQVLWSLPTRSDGYGLQETYLGELIVSAPDLIIAVDCGSNDRAVIEQLLAAGIDVVVIDHHQINEDVSDLVPVANPQRDDDEQARYIVGAGMAWLVVQKLADAGAVPADVPDGLLDLAAIGTIGDVGKLLGYNRALVIAGGKKLRECKRLGLKTLTRMMNLDPIDLNAEAVSFRLVPKLNAPGRIYIADIVVDLLLTTSWDEAEVLAKQVLDADESRRLAMDEAQARLLARYDDETLIESVLICEDQAMSHGIAGPLASRLVERYRRPVVVLAGQGDELSGSARSIGEWDIAGALYAMPDGMLLRRGGHSKAAGLAVERSGLEAFRMAMIAAFAESGIAVPLPAEMEASAYVDDDPLTLPVAQELDKLGPFGSGNPRPTLQWNGVRASNVEPIGKDGNTLRMFLSRGTDRLLGVMFRAGDAGVIGNVHDGDLVDVLIQLTIERFKGQKQLKMFIRDIRPSV